MHIKNLKKNKDMRDCLFILFNDCIVLGTPGRRKSYTTEQKRDNAATCTNYKFKSILKLWSIEVIDGGKERSFLISVHLPKQLYEIYTRLLHHTNIAVVLSNLFPTALQLKKQNGCVPLSRLSNILVFCRYDRV